MTIRRFACALALLLMMAASMASARPQTLQASGVPFEKLSDVVTRNCARCHFKGSPASRVIALDELISSPERSMREEIPWRKVYARVLVSRSMPPADSGISLSDDDSATIWEWIEGNFRPSLASAAPGARGS